MSKFLMSILLLASVAVSAQEVKLDKYPLIPDELNGTFADFCHPFASGIANGTHGQYFGQITPSKNMYGYGRFLSHKDETVTGQFRQNTLVFGITMGTHVVKVGSKEHYISYDLTNGKPLYITKDGKHINVPLEAESIYRFQSLTYSSGDKYVGETVNGKRDGYGIYMYKNGDFFYGSYKNNDRYGWGATFTTSNQVIIQHF